MKRWTLPLLLALNLGLLAWLASLWFTPDGRLTGVRWQPPPALKPSLDGGSALPATGVELGRYVATLERPLFMPSRRPRARRTQRQDRPPLTAQRHRPRHRRSRGR